MSGQEELMTGSHKKLAELNKILDEYENGLHLNLSDEYEVNQYLNMKKDQLEALTPIQCAEIATYLSNYLIYLQQQVNRENAKVNWASSNIKLIIGKYITQYNDFKYEAKVAQIIHENETANLLEKIRIAAQTRVDSLAYIPNRIDFFVKTLTNLANVKAYKV